MTQGRCSPTTAAKRDYTAEGQASYQAWRPEFFAGPEYRNVYQEEATENRPERADVQTNL